MCGNRWHDSRTCGTCVTLGGADEAEAVDVPVAIVP